MFSPIRVTDEKQPRHTESSLDLVGNAPGVFLPAIELQPTYLKQTFVNNRLHIWSNLICKTVSQYIDTEYVEQKAIKVAIAVLVVTAATALNSK